MNEKPENLKTAELCLKAVKQHSRAIKYVPEVLRDEVKNAVGC